MTKYLISFPAPAMDIPEEDWVEVGEAARAVMREAKHAGAYVFGGGINFASPGRGPCRRRPLH